VIRRKRPRTAEDAGAQEISGNSSGRVSNKGMEGLAISPDGTVLFGAMQSPLIQDGGTDGAVTRIIAIDIATGATRQLAYKLTNIGIDITGAAASPARPTSSRWRWPRANSSTW
jgi:hypothetical protein